ncbi:MAG: response regulator transcription factor [Eubacteriaceae bacterium]|nr:response regulator transcription factor [Eubacteriaceae bacterium]
MTKKKVLIVEDDELIVRIETDYLEAARFTVAAETNGTDGFRRMTSEDFDAVILDIMLPGMNGYDVCREFRKVSSVPVIMVTARREDEDKIQGLGLGADDYVEKPFSPAVLVARVEAHIAVHERLLAEAGKQPEKTDIYAGPLVILQGERSVLLNNEEISLTVKEFELLAFLAGNPNLVFSKNELFRTIWGMDPLDDNSTVTVHINRLRQKIEEDPSEPRYILTVWGAGYKFSI